MPRPHPIPVLVQRDDGCPSSTSRPASRCVPFARRQVVLPLALAWCVGCRRGETAPEVAEEVARLATDSETEQYTALKNLQWMSVRGAAAVPALRVLLAKTADDDLRAEIAKTLGRIGPPAEAAVPDLVKLLGSRAMWPRYCAVEALGLIGPAAVAAIPKVEPLTRDRDRDVAEAASEALQRLRRAAAARRGQR
ncbi:MAG: HEAT repeat domain-containing protein [Planctomycetes bacterium]|nr:HEAT repeat domain-containing protein [Planctomycetota bacterium]